MEEKTEYNKLLTNLDTQIGTMVKDSSVWVSPMNELIILLSKAQWEAKKLAKNYKTSYEMNIITKKEEWEKKIMESEEYKTKPRKISDAELNRYAEKELMKEYKDYKEQESISDYLTPILEAYTNYVAGFKSDRTEGIKITRFNDNQS